MKIKTKFKIGDWVVYDNRYCFQIGGIVIFEDTVAYFEEYEENNYEEKNLKLYKQGDLKNVK